MKRLTLILASSLLLMACSKQEPAPEPVRPVLWVEVKAEDQENLGRFAGTIQARYESNLGFRVPGRIARRAVDVGAEVSKGALLAVLDPTDQQNQLRAAQGDLARVQAQFINAQANARRQQELFNRGVGAQAQLDVAQTDLKTTQASLDQAKAAVDQARDQLNYAELRTDHGGIVTAWNAEAGQVVSAGQQVVTLARPDIKEAVIDLPAGRRAPAERCGVPGGQPVGPQRQHHRHRARDRAPGAKRHPHPSRAPDPGPDAAGVAPGHGDQRDLELGHRPAYRTACQRGAGCRRQDPHLGRRYATAERAAP